MLLYHTGVLRGGWIGVDTFFVLSGYLITSLLLAEHDRTGGIALKAFWGRRARRLLPALFLLLAGVGLFAALVATAEARSVIRQDLWGALTYGSNWLDIVRGSGYWQTFAQPSPLAHVWSLAIEEQFYVVWPLVAWWALRRGGARRLATVAAAGGGRARRLGASGWRGPARRSTASTWARTQGRRPCSSAPPSARCGWGRPGPSSGGWPTSRVRSGWPCSSGRRSPSTAGTPRSTGARCSGCRWPGRWPSSGPARTTADGSAGSWGGGRCASSGS